MEQFFLCGGIVIPKKSGSGVRSRAKEYLREVVADFDEEKDYFCGINTHTPTTAISWREVKGSDEMAAFPANIKGNYKYERYFIMKFKGENEPLVILLAGDDRDALLNKFISKKANNPLSDLSRVNIDENIKGE